MYQSVEISFANQTIHVSEQTVWGRGLFYPFSSCELLYYKGMFFFKQPIPKKCISNP